MLNIKNKKEKILKLRAKTFKLLIIVNFNINATNTKIEERSTDS